MNLKFEDMWNEKKMLIEANIAGMNGMINIYHQYFVGLIPQN